MIIPWHIGSSEESYGAAVWFARVENLRSHLRIIGDHLPEDCDWLANQVRYAIEQADSYLKDWSPLASVGRNPEGEDREDGLRAQHEHAVPPVEAGDAQNPPKG